MTLEKRWAGHPRRHSDGYMHIMPYPPHATDTYGPINFPPEAKTIGLSFQVRLANHPCLTCEAFGETDQRDY